MFKKSRRKIVAAIMSVLVVLFLGTLVVIYIASYLDVSKSNYEMLDRHAKMYSLYNQTQDNTLDNTPPDLIKPDQNKKDAFDLNHSPEFELSTFYSVALTKNGEILATDTSDNGVYEEAQLEEYALDIVSENKTKGMKGELIYLVSEKNGYVLVTFMDNRIINESMNTLLRYTIIFGSITITVMFFLAVYLAKRIVKPLEESYQKQKQFISDAGHELKTPIAVVNANAEMLQRDIGENQWLANIQYENERMRLLVGQLLELARTENVQPQMARLDFSHLTTGEVLPFESIAYEKGLSIKAEILPDLWIDGDSIQLKLLISILIDNAIRHSENGNNIVVKLTESRTSVILSVANSGKLIPPEQQERLFDLFYRVDDARNSEDNHYGLGLAIAKAIVTTHNGKIEIRCYDGLVEFSVTIPKA